MAEEILGNCCAALVCISVVLTTVILVFCEPLLMAFGASADTIGYATGYLRIYTAGTIFVQVVMGLNMFITSQGFAQVGMKTTIIGAVCNIVLDPVFIFLFDMGVQGAALATIISQAISAIWVLVFLTGNGGCMAAFLGSCDSGLLRFPEGFLGGGTQCLFGCSFSGLNGDSTLFGANR